jgi:hypothetical protein
MMSQKPDATKIEAALRRAAYKATQGSREERSGRFLVKNRPASAKGNSRLQGSAGVRRKA